MDCFFVFLKVCLLLRLQVLKLSGFSSILLVLIVDLVSLLYGDLLWLVVWVLCKKFLFAFLLKFNKHFPQSMYTRPKRLLLSSISCMDFLL